MHLTHLQVRRELGEKACVALKLGLFSEIPAFLADFAHWSAGWRCAWRLPAASIGTGALGTL